MLDMDTIIEVYANPDQENDLLLCRCTLGEFAEANADAIDDLTIRRLRLALKTNPAQLIGGGAAPALLICLPD